jgi:hypothetical protein
MAGAQGDDFRPDSLAGREESLAGRKIFALLGDYFEQPIRLRPDSACQGRGKRRPIANQPQVANLPYKPIRALSGTPQSADDR